jgi:hypothetical protein
LIFQPDFCFGLHIGCNQSFYILAQSFVAHTNSQTLF